MEDQITDLRRRLAEAEARAVEEQHKSQQAEARAAEEQRRRGEEQQRRAQKSRPKHLVEYLEACHSFSCTLEVVTNATLTTQGETTKPAGQAFPQRIVP
jgi:hypothetical protein